MLISDRFERRVVWLGGSGHMSMGVGFAIGISTKQAATALPRRRQVDGKWIIARGTCRSELVVFTLRAEWAQTDRCGGRRTRNRVGRLEGPADVDNSLGQGAWDPRIGLERSSQRCVVPSARQGRGQLGGRARMTGDAAEWIFAAW